jgi:hypothetical protein
LTKKVIKIEDKKENIEQIMENPLRANKHQNKLFVGNLKKKEEIV